MLILGLSFEAPPPPTSWQLSAPIVFTQIVPWPHEPLDDVSELWRIADTKRIPNSLQHGLLATGSAQSGVIREIGLVLVLHP